MIDYIWKRLPEDRDEQVESVPVFTLYKDHLRLRVTLSWIILVHFSRYIYIYIHRYTHAHTSKQWVKYWCRNATDSWSDVNHPYNNLIRMRLILLRAFVAASYTDARRSNHWIIWLCIIIRIFPSKIIRFCLTIFKWILLNSRWVCVF